MKNLALLLFLSINILACTQNIQDDKNGEIAENFIGLVLTQPHEAQKLLHDNFKFRYMGMIPDTHMGEYIINDSYNKDTYFTEFLEVVGALVPNGIVLTPINTISDGNEVAVVMEGRAEGKNGSYNNNYVFTYEFSDGKILSLDEYNSDILVATRLYDNKLTTFKPSSVR